MQDLLAQADQALFDGDPARARSLLGQLDARAQRGGGAVLTALRDAVEAITAGAEDKPQDLPRLLRALDAGVPLPGLLLAAGRILRRRPQHQARAADCYLQLELLGHSVLAEFYSAVPPEQRLRYLPVIRRLFQAKRSPEHLLLLLALKQGLRKTLSVEEMGTVYARSFGLAAELPQWLEIDNFQLQAQRPAAHSVEVFAQQGFSLTLPRIPGQPPVQSEPLAGRQMLFAAIDDAEVSGQSSMVASGGRVLFDWQGQELEQVVPVPAYDPLVLLRRRNQLARLRPGQDGGIGELDQAFHLLGWSSGMFGHWICEYLPKVFAMLRHELLAGVPILIDEGMPAPHRQALQLFLGDRNPLIVVPLWAGMKVRRLWVCSNAMYVPIYPKPGQNLDYRHMSAPPGPLAALFAVGNAVFERQHPTRPMGRRIYFARRPGQHRKLLNHVQVEARMHAAGFEIIYSETLSFAEQLRTVREASHIVGPEGSALMLGFFARSGTRLAMLNHEYLENLPTVSGLLEACGVETSIVTGRTVRKDEAAARYSDYEIAPEQLDALLAAWQLPAAATSGATP